VHDDDALIARCLEAGASGYIRTGDHVAQLRNAIDAACLDKRAIGSETAEIGVRSA